MTIGETANYQGIYTDKGDTTHLIGYDLGFANFIICIEIPHTNQ